MALHMLAVLAYGAALLVVLWVAFYILPPLRRETRAQIENWLAPECAGVSRRHL